MKPKVLVTREVFDETLEYLGAHCEVESNQEDVALAPDELRRRAADKDGVMCSLTDRIDAHAASTRCAKLKVVANIAVGYNNIDVAGVHRARHPGDEHAGRARRQHRRSRLDAHARRGAAHDRSRAPRARRRVDGLAAEAVARHRRAPRDARHRRHGPHRTGDREARGGLRHARALPQPQARCGRASSSALERDLGEPGRAAARSPISSCCRCRIRPRRTTSSARRSSRR